MKDGSNPFPRLSWWLTDRDDAYKVFKTERTNVANRKNSINVARLFLLKGWGSFKKCLNLKQTHTSVLYLYYHDFPSEQVCMCTCIWDSWSWKECSEWLCEAAANPRRGASSFQNERQGHFPWSGTPDRLFFVTRLHSQAVESCH